MRKHTRNLLWFSRSSWYIHTYIHKYLIWEQKHLKRLNNNNMYESGTEDVCTDVCLIYSIYTAELFRKNMHMCLHLYSTSSKRVNNWRWAMNYRRELQNTGNNSCVGCFGWRWHGRKLFLYLEVLVYRDLLHLPEVRTSNRLFPGCEGSVWYYRFFTLDLYKSWMLGRCSPMILSAVLTVCCSLLISDLLADPNHTVISEHRIIYQ